MFRENKKGVAYLLPLLLIVVVASVLIYTLINSGAFAKRGKGGPGGDGGGGKVKETCETKSERPCYDKQTGQKINPLNSKNGPNTLSACLGSASDNEVGDFIHQTPVCDQEIVTYCHEGNSDTFIRFFTGECDDGTPPNPEPSPPPTPAPNTDFIITAPNGSEQWGFGTAQKMTWQGGEDSPDWPVFISVIDPARTRALREMVVGTTNDGEENWIVDLPLGDYVMYAQGCRFCNDIERSKWDYSDQAFSVVAGAQIEKVNSGSEMNQSLVVLSPSGNETLATGSTHNLLWSGGTSSWDLRMSLASVANNTTYTNLHSSTANDGVEGWTIPSYVPPGQYKLFIGCNNCGEAPAGATGGFYGYSFYPFDITLP